MQCRRIFQSLAIGSMFLVSNSFAGVSGDLSGYFNKMGFANNVTDAQAWQGQSAGYYNGGSLFLRAPSRDLQLASVNLPSIRAGCGGISTFLGGFSFIKGKELVQFAKEVMSNAETYTFQLAMETFAPQINQIFSKLQYWAQQMNQNNMSSCQAAQDLIGGLWPKHTAAQGLICKNLGQYTGKFTDWAEARQQCGAGGQGSSTLNSLAKTKQGKKTITRNVNIVWRQLMKDPMLNEDPSLAEFFMSLSGTVVFDSGGNPHTYPSLIKNQGILEELLTGSTGNLGSTPKIYTCTDIGSQSKCLDIARTTFSITPSDALQSQVNQILLDIEASYKNDTALTKIEKGFIDSTSIPVAKFIQISLESGNSINTQDYAQIISQEILAKYLDGVIQLMREDLMYSHFTSSMKAIMNSLAQANVVVENLKSTVTQKIQALTELLQQSEAFQKMIVGSLSGQFKTN